MAPLAARVGPKQLLPVCKTSALWRSQQRGFADSITNFLLQACDCALQQPSWGLLSLLPFRSSSKCAPSSPAHGLDLNEAGPDSARGPHVLISSFDETWLMWNIYIYIWVVEWNPGLCTRRTCNIHLHSGPRPKGTLDFEGQEGRVSCPLRFFLLARWMTSRTKPSLHIQDYATLLGLDDNQALARMPSHDMSHAWHVLATWTLRVVIVATGPCR